MGRGRVPVIVLSGIPPPRHRVSASIGPMKIFPWRAGDPAISDDDVNESIIDMITRKPPPFGGDHPLKLEPGTVPITRIPAPPFRRGRPELHVTSPQGITSKRPSRASRVRALRASSGPLPVFRETTEVLGWAAFLRPRQPLLTVSEAIRAIGVYTEKTQRRTCQQTEAARAELREREKDFELREAQLRRHLNK